ncbi:hypothetical protein LCGC14_2160910 [marine sediment metagenome]|uniref:Uncharacterized protein n=1 Tax=marine sediment metagenome TaxID=412755 RepID=A0A0F9EF39_9ZZZZ
MKNRLQITLNLLIPIAIFLLSFTTGSIANSYAGGIKGLNQLSQTAPPAYFSLISKIGFIGLLASTAAFVIWSFLVVKSKGKKYMLETEVAALTVAMIVTVNMMAPFLLVYEYVEPLLSNLR